MVQSPAAAGGGEEEEEDGAILARRVARLREIAVRRRWFITFFGHLPFHCAASPAAAAGVKLGALICSWRLEPRVDVF